MVPYERRKFDRLVNVRCHVGDYTFERYGADLFQDVHSFAAFNVDKYIVRSGDEVVLCDHFC